MVSLVLTWSEGRMNWFGVHGAKLCNWIWRCWSFLWNICNSENLCGIACLAIKTMCTSDGRHRVEQVTSH